MMDLYNSLELNVSVIDVGVCCNMLVIDLWVVGVDIIMRYFNYGELINERIKWIDLIFLLCYDKFKLC